MRKLTTEPRLNVWLRAARIEIYDLLGSGAISNISSSDYARKEIYQAPFPPKVPGNAMISQSPPFPLSNSCSCNSYCSSKPGGNVPDSILDLILWRCRAMSAWASSGAEVTAANGTKVKQPNPSRWSPFPCALLNYVRKVIMKRPSKHTEVIVATQRTLHHPMRSRSQWQNLN